MTDEDQQPDALRDLLRAADPADSLRPLDPHRVSRLLEDTMAHDRLDTSPAQSPLADNAPTEPHPEPQPLPESGSRRRRGARPLNWLVAAAAVTLIGATGVVGLSRDDDDAVVRADEPAGTTGDASTRLSLAAPLGRCAMPSAELVAGQELAFEGTVVSIEESADGRVVVLSTDDVLIGRGTDAVELTLPAAGVTDADVRFEVGQTYLVAASDGRAVPCGVTGPATPELTRLYEQATRTR